MSVINWVAFGGILVDLVIISIIISNAFWGYRRGLVNVIFQALAFIVSLLIMFVLYKPVANTIMNATSLDETLSSAIASNLTGTTLEDGELLNAEQSNISTSVVNLINSFVTEALNKAETDVVAYASNQLAKVMIYTGTMLLLFIVSRTLLVFVRFVAELIGNFARYLIATFILPVITGVAIMALDKRKIRPMLIGILGYPLFLGSWIIINLKCLIKPNTKWEKIEHVRDINIQEVKQETTHA